MKIPAQRRLSARGSLLAIALVMTMLGGIFLAGWVALANARAMQARGQEYAMKRRLTLENSRAYVRQMCLEQAYSGNSSVAAYVSGDVGPGWGGLNTDVGWNNLRLYGLPPTDVSYPAAGYYTKVFPFNALGLRPNVAFSSIQRLVRPSAYDGSTYDAIDPFNGYAFMKGIFPALAGDALVIYRKPDRAPGEIQLSNFQVGNSGASTPGRFVVRDPASLYNSAEVDLGVKKTLNVRAKSFYLQKNDPLNPVVARNLTGGEQMTLNLPTTASTYGPRMIGSSPSNTTQLFRGDLNIVKNTYVPPGLPATVTHHPNCLWEIQNREAIKATSPVPVQTISVGSSFGSPTDAYWIADQALSPTYPPPRYPFGYDSGFQVLFINLNHPDLPNLRIYPVVQQVVFYGQSTSAEYTAAANMAPRIILFVPMPGSPQTFKDVRFARENNRPFVLGMQAQLTGEPVEFYWMPPNVNSTALTMDWRMIMINEGRQVSCYRPTGAGGTPDAVQITGGFFSNWSVQRKQPGIVGDDPGTANKFILLPDPLSGWNSSVTPPTPLLATTAGYNFASILPREAWLESFFHLAPP